MGHEAGGSGALALVPSWVPAADDSPPETALADRLLVVPDGSEAALVVSELRVPRTVLALAAGAALGLAGR